MAALEAEEGSRFPWGDLRLWAFPLLLGGLGGLADAGWAELFPDRAPAIVAVGVASFLVALGTTAVALHPRAARWTAAGNVVPALWAVLVALALARPISGPAFWAFGWSCALLLYIWTKARGFVRSAVRQTMAGPLGGPAGLLPPIGGGIGGAAFAAHVAHATVDVLWGVGLWVAFCDLGRRGTAHGGLVPLALAAGAGALCLASWANRAAVWAESRGRGTLVQPGFVRGWWWAAVPAICLCLAAGLVVPLYPAPLQHGSIGAVVVRIAAFTTARFQQVQPLPPPGRGLPHARADARTLVAFLVLLLIAGLAWPLRRVTARLLARIGLGDEGRWQTEAEERVPWSARLGAWWTRFRGFWHRLFARQRPQWRGPHWRPLTPPPPRAVDPRPAGPEAARDDLRGRVRAAYGRLLQRARLLGLARSAAHTPRQYREWLNRQVPAGQAPLAELTRVYEEARFSRHAVDPATAQNAEMDAQAVEYALDTFTRSRRPTPKHEERLQWTAPRGFGRGKQV